MGTKEKARSQKPKCHETPKLQDFGLTSLRQQRTTFTFKALFDTEDYDGAIPAAQDLRYCIGTAMACSQLPPYDTENYGSDSSGVQVPWATEQAQPWLSESIGFTTQDGFLRLPWPQKHIALEVFASTSFSTQDGFLRFSLNHRHPHCPQFVRQKSLHGGKGHPILAWRPCWLTAVDLSHPG